VRVVIDGRLLAYTAGGIARYASELYAALAGMDSQDEFVLAVSRKTSRGGLLTPPHHRLEQAALPVEMARLRPHVVHSPDFVPSFVRTWRSVVTVHDIAFLRFPELLTPESRVYYGRVGAAIRSADRTIAVSWHTARDVAERLRIPEDRIRVVPNGVGRSFRPVPDDLDSRGRLQGLGVDGPYVLFVGTIEPRKNLPTLVRAFERVREAVDVKLVVAGRAGWLAEASLAAIDSSPARGWIVRVEPTDADLPLLYSRAQVLCLPSLYEGFGIPMVEAMACGVPVVASSGSALPEIGADAALYHDPTSVEALTEQLRRALTDTEQRAGMVRRGLARAASFTWERCAERTLRVYREAAL
jgi:glycosyltransferase involved in cell wall biosynthesis